MLELTQVGLVHRCAQELTRKGSSSSVAEDSEGVPHLG
jgi:hypothetical protein